MMVISKLKERETIKRKRVISKLKKRAKNRLLSNQRRIDLRIRRVRVSRTYDWT